MVKKKEENKSNELWYILLLAALLFVLLINVLLTNSRVEFEADCGIEGLNFEINETHDLSSFSLNDGSINCKFKGDIPMGIALRGLE